MLFINETEGCYFVCSGETGLCMPFAKLYICLLLCWCCYLNKSKEKKKTVSCGRKEILFSFQVELKSM